MNCGAVNKYNNVSLYPSLALSTHTMHLQLERNEEARWKQDRGCPVVVGLVRWILRGENYETKGECNQTFSSLKDPRDLHCRKNAWPQKSSFHLKALCKMHTIFSGKLIKACSHFSAVFNLLKI